MKTRLITITLLSLGIFFLSGVSALADEHSIPGQIQETGTLFEITDSEYLNVSLESSEEITVLLESVPKTISMIIEASESAVSTDLFISNLESEKTYYKYEDSYKNEVEFVADKKGKYTWTQDLTESHHVWFQEERGTIFIPEDCDTYGIWDSGTSTCTLTQDLTESVEITANGVTLNCNNHSIVGNQTGYGVYLNNKSGTITKNCSITNFTNAIYLESSSNNIIDNNSISPHIYWAIRVQNSSNSNIISNNTIDSAADSGIWLWRLSSYNTVVNNIISYGIESPYRGGIRLHEVSNNDISNNIFVNDGIIIRDSYQNTIEDNLVNGRPIIYLEDKSDYTVPSGAGQVILVNCDNIIVENLDLSGALVPIQLLRTTNSRIENNDMVASGGSHCYYGTFLSLGIYLENSLGNSLSRNKGSGICLVDSSTTNTIDSNNVSNIVLFNSSFNNIVSNEEINGWLGLYLHSSSDNVINNNDFVNSGLLINRYSVKNVVENNIVNGSPLVYLEDVSDYTITNAGQVILVNCDNITVKNIDFSVTNVPIQLYRTKNSKIKNNNMTWQKEAGISLDYSSNNLMSENTMNLGYAAVYGIRLRDSSNNNIINNNDIHWTYYGIFLSDYSSNNKIYHNNFIYSSARIENGVSNLFDNGYPIDFDPAIHGGNYWSGYVGVDLYSGPNQDESGSDGMGDTPYTFYGGQDNYPFMVKNGWEGPPPVNQPPTFSDLGQYKSDGVTPIFEGGTTTESTVVFKATVSDPDNDKVKLQVQIKEVDHEWQDIIESDFVNSGSEATKTRYGLVEGQYRWRARAMDEKGAISGDWQEFGMPGNVDFEVKLVPTYNVAVILAEPANVPHEDFTPSGKPCKLDQFQSETYPEYNKKYYEHLAYCVADYHKENSFGTINLDFEIFDNDGSWFRTTKNEGEYIADERNFVIDAINLATEKGIDLSDKDMVIVLHAGEAAKTKEEVATKLQTMTWGLASQPLGYPPYKIIVAEDDLVGGWTHEIGHIMGALITPENTIIPDLSVGMGNVGEWDLMAVGSRNDGGSNPPYMSSYTKEFLGWLNYDIHPKSAYGEYWINSLDNSKFGDNVFRYNLSEDVNDESPKYYILEARNRNLRTWDSSLPEEKGLVLYLVNTKNYPEYGYDEDGLMNNQHRKINIRNILTPDGDSYLDMWRLINFTALSDEQTADLYRIKAKIEKADFDFFTDKFHGVILEPASQFYQKIIKYLPLGNASLRFVLYYRQEFRRTGGMVGPWVDDDNVRKEEIIALIATFFILNILFVSIFVLLRKKKRIKMALKVIWIILILGFVMLIYLYFTDIGRLADIYEALMIRLGCEEKNIPIPLGPKLPNPLFETATMPDLDLYLYCDDGRHIGMNYQTGEYENQIQNSIVSGDNQDSPEWIFIPPDITGCHFVISSYDNQKFLEENPEIAKEMEDTTDSYEIYARYIDPATAIYTSTIISEDIKPGIELEHQVTGTEDIVIEPGILIVNIDIKPGSDLNSINLKSKGVIPVAVLSDEFFDAEDIVTDSIIFAGVDPSREKFEDVDGDDDLDLILHFETQSLQLTPDNTEAVLTGELNDGTLIEGTDLVRIISKKK